MSFLIKIERPSAPESHVETQVRESDVLITYARDAVSYSSETYTSMIRFLKSRSKDRGTLNFFISEIVEVGETCGC